MTTADQPRWIDYLPLDELEAAPKNPKSHSPSIGQSLARFGYVEAIALDERTGRLVAGHGRKAELLAKQAAGEDPPEGIVVGDDGRWLAPVQRGWSSGSDGEAAAYVVASNQTSIAGGWDMDSLAGSLSDMENLIGLGFTDEDRESLQRLMHARSDAPVDAQRDWDAAGMGPFQNEDGTPAIQVRVSFISEADFDRFRDLLGMVGPRRNRIWFPEQPDLIESNEELTVDVP